MNEAEDSVMTIGFQYMLRCGHTTKEDEITMNGKLTVLADPIKTLKDAATCNECGALTMVEEVRLYWKWESDLERIEEEEKQREGRTVVHAN